jgi:branched-chain amino acid aminotransferase
MDIKTPYIWKNWKFIKWDDAKDHNLTHALHYWTWVFEWIRFYKTDKWPKIFKLKQHIDRLFYSASVLALEINFTKEEIMQVHIDSVAKSWIESGYIRPIIYYWEWKMWMQPLWAKTEIVISVWNWWKVLADRPVDVKISKYKRMHPETADMNAKVSWWYYNNVLVSLEMKKEWFDEWLLLDTNWFIAEWPWENIFFVKWNEIFTPEKWTILPWITRNTIIQIAKEKMWIDVKEIKILPENLWDFNEVFFCGTAVEISPIWTITFNWEKILYKSWEENSISNRIKEFYMNIVSWKDFWEGEKYLNWLS